MHPEQTNSLLLSVTLFLPVLGALFIALIPKEQVTAPRWVALFFAFLTMVLGGLLACGFDNALTAQPNTYQFRDYASWIPQLGVTYHVGLDGLSMPMVLLTTVLVFVAVLTSSSWNLTDRPKMYFFLLMMLETGVLGVFASLDLFMFFIMWELELIPMYFLIGLWGGPRREYAAMKFILYTVLGSAFMFVVFLALYWSSPIRTFDLQVLIAQNPASTWGDPRMQTLGFFALFIPFAIKLPMVPVHTWLPDAHVEAPTAISVLLAGILLKMGAYGIFRLNMGLFPMVADTPTVAFVLGALGTLSIIYGALLALSKTDIKQVIAYSSISHMGFVLLGYAALNDVGINGAVLQMFSHGVITAMLFMLVGVVYDRTHTRDLGKIGGLAVRMPRAATFWAITAFAAVGLPGTSGFVAEFITFLGAFKTQPLLTTLAATGIILGAGYMLWLVERMMFGPLKLLPPADPHHLGDANGREIFALCVLLVFVIGIGLYPAVLTDAIDPAVANLLHIIAA